jgi:hypothetical protein
MTGAAATVSCLSNRWKHDRCIQADAVTPLPLWKNKSDSFFSVSHSQEIHQRCPDFFNAFLDNRMSGTSHQCKLGSGDRSFQIMSNPHVQVDISLTPDNGSRTAYLMEPIGKFRSGSNAIMDKIVHQKQRAPLTR